MTVGTYNISASIVTQNAIKLADVDVIFNQGINSSSYKSTANGSVSGALTAGSAATVKASLAYSSLTKAISSQDALDALKLSVGLSTSAGTMTSFDSCQPTSIRTVKSLLKMLFLFLSIQ